MSVAIAGRPVKINTLEHDFAESMVSLDFSAFLAETGAARAELEEQRFMKEPEERFPLVVEVLYDIAPPRLGRIYPGEDADAEIRRMPDVWTALEQRKGRGDEVFFYAALLSGKDFQPQHVYGSFGVHGELVL